MNWKTRLKDENTERGIKGEKKKKEKETTPNNSTEISKNLENERHESRLVVY